METLFIAGIFLLAAVLFCVYIYSIIWSYSDAQERGKPGIAVALLVALLSWPLGLLAWIIFRPEQASSSAFNSRFYNSR
ncbi:hypothetical protein [Rubellicoccus peritrichatus]|uniref:Cardiolipin synthase N-terminal domain-containing protein n=1 Tax=Rubellicoccus peritrichatus TaxID=3080537 RepID=A0AAQ3L9X6_9BACT|nr:hypothetical protein [Puniceicoccus sp. CR14]WOO40045.1 hypothetical protein RZN69_15585 [Puniceicoccus sp. CR14]